MLYEWKLMNISSSQRCLQVFLPEGPIILSPFLRMEKQNKNVPLILLFFIPKRGNM